MPTLIDQGETWSSPTYEVRDSNGTLVAGATVTATATVDGTTTATTIDSTGTGTYTIDYPTAGVVGLVSIVVTATGGPLGSIIRRFESTFTVVPPGSLLVDADDALAHLRAQKVIKGAADVDQLRWYCLVATDAVARDLGRAVVREVVTEQHTGGRPSIRLRRTPVRSITSVTESGTALSATDGVDWVLDEDVEVGYLYRGSNTCASCWAWGRKNITVTYVAGYVSPPHILRKVALDVVTRTWQTSQQARHELVDDVGADQAVFEAIGSLTSPDQAAYASLRAAGIA